MRMAGSQGRRSLYDDEVDIDAFGSASRVKTLEEAFLRRSPFLQMRKRHGTNFSDISTTGSADDDEEEIGVFSLDGISAEGDRREREGEDEDEDDYGCGETLFQYQLVGLDDEGDEDSNYDLSGGTEISFSPKTDYMNSPGNSSWEKSPGPPQHPALRPSPSPFDKVPLMDSEDENMLPPRATAPTSTEDKDLLTTRTLEVPEGVSPTVRAALNELVAEASYCDIGACCGLRCDGAGAGRRGYEGHGVECGPEMEDWDDEEASIFMFDDRLKAGDFTAKAEDDEETSIFMMDNFSRAREPAAEDDLDYAEVELGASFVWWRQLVDRASLEF